MLWIDLKKVFILLPMVDRSTRLSDCQWWTIWSCRRLAEIMQDPFMLPAIQALVLNSAYIILSTPTYSFIHRTLPKQYNYFYCQVLCSLVTVNHNVIHHVCVINHYGQFMETFIRSHIFWWFLISVNFVYCKIEEGVTLKNSENNF